MKKFFTLLMITCIGMLASSAMAGGVGGEQKEKGFCISDNADDPHTIVTDTAESKQCILGTFCRSGDNECTEKMDKRIEALKKEAKEKAKASADKPDEAKEAPAEKDEEGAKWAKKPAGEVTCSETITRYICSEIVDGEVIKVAYSEPGYCPGGAGYVVEDSRQPIIIPEGDPQFSESGKEMGENGDTIVFAMKQKRVCRNPFSGLVLKDGAPNGLPPPPPPAVVKGLSGSDTALIVIGSVAGATAIAFGIYGILYATGHAPALHTTHVYPRR